LTLLRLHFMLWWKTICNCIQNILKSGKTALVLHNAKSKKSILSMKLQQRSCPHDNMKIKQFVVRSHIPPNLTIRVGIVSRELTSTSCAKA